MRLVWVEGGFLHQELYLPLIDYQVALLKDTLKGPMVLFCWVFLEGVEVVFSEETLYFTGVFVSVHDYSGSAFVCPGDHGLPSSEFVIYDF